MVFETTASNTVDITASCVSMQNVLNRPLLWLACQHHIGEIILTHVWNSLEIEVSKGPNISLFLRFKKNFEHLNCQTIEDLDIPQISQSLINKKDAITNLCQEAMRQNFSRDDYRELVQLMLLYLSNGQNVVFSGFIRPGAFHNARWMAKLLYSIKLALLNKKISQLPKGTILALQ
nr:uncharacterized protein LOC124806425 [Hydra vulgaris]XP_047123270.1 uncharacterized protein LOC124806425 [Hydra vulgaris]